MQNIIQALKSKTVRIAIVQAVLGIAIVVLTEADMVGYATLLKSALDIWLRSVTTVPLSDK